jgi:hypothetical protein
MIAQDNCNMYAAKLVCCDGLYAQAVSTHTYPPSHTYSTCILGHTFRKSAYEPPSPYVLLPQQTILPASEIAQLHVEWSRPYEQCMQYNVCNCSVLKHKTMHDSFAHCLLVAKGIHTG